MIESLKQHAASGGLDGIRDIISRKGSESVPGMISQNININQAGNIKQQRRKVIIKFPALL